MDKSNIITSVLYLKESSDLLKDVEEEISLTLLKLAKALLDNYSIEENQIDEAKKISLEISSQTSDK